MDIKLQAIGFVQNQRKDIVDDNWGAIESTIEIDSNLFDDEALLGINHFSHVEVVFYMDRVTQSKISTGSRHPRNDSKLPKYGILAQRGKNRPNTLGVSFAKVVSIDGFTLTVLGLDAIDGTPVLDIKPCFEAFLPQGEIKQPDWVHSLMSNYYN